MIEVEPELKRELYAALSLSGSTLKDWFLQCAQQYCGDAAQMQLFSQAERTRNSTPD